MKIGVILAGGQSSRFISDIPKGLHEIDGKSIVSRVIDCLRVCEVEKIFIVVNNDNYDCYKSIDRVDFLFQGEVKGTGGAFYSVNGLFNEEDELIVVNSDCFVFDKRLIRNFYYSFSNTHFDLGLVTYINDNPFGQGRIFGKDIIRIIEEKECSEEEKKIKEVNCGIYVFRGSFLKNNMRILNIGRGESKITSLFDNKKSYKYLSNEPIISVNNKEDFYEVNKQFYLFNCYKHLNRGVKILDINNTYIGEDVVIGRDVTIYPNNYLLGNSIIGDNSHIMPNCFINDSQIGKGCIVGPFANVKGNNVIGDNCVVGAFVEMKNSFLQKEVKAKHHAYIGDCFIGEKSNIGCGVIVANYDGKKKNKTIIGKRCFIGSNVTLVAPINIGNNCVVAAGSTITKDVEEYSLAIAREREIIKRDYYKK